MALEAGHTTRQVDPGPLLDDQVTRLLHALAVHGEETRIVGGALRNWMMRLPVADIDLATTLLPHDVEVRARAAGLAQRRSSGF